MIGFVRSFLGLVKFGYGTERVNHHQMLLLLLLLLLMLLLLLLLLLLMMMMMMIFLLFFFPLRLSRVTAELEAQEAENKHLAKEILELKQENSDLHRR